MINALWFNGRLTFAMQVNLLEASHHRIADYLRQNTPADAVVATHDIGLFGYYSNRRLVDLAGLITPETLAYLQDAHGLARYCEQQGVRYLAVFSGYYPGLLQDLQAVRIFAPDSPHLLSLGLEPFELFKVKTKDQ